MKKIIAIIFLIFVIPVSSFSQFDVEVPKVKLFDLAFDIQSYGYMLVKDKLFLINNLDMDNASKEFDFALSKVEEKLMIIDFEEHNTNIKTKLRALKNFWFKFNQNVTENMNNKNFRSVSFDVNNWNRLCSDLIESMKAEYDLPLNDLKLYMDLQNFRVLINKVTTNYLANSLNLSRNFFYEYKKNIEDINLSIKNKSNSLLNNPLTENVFLKFIIDWDFMRLNLSSETNRNYYTVFALSTGMDYHLRKIKDRDLQTFIDKKS